MDVSMFVLFSVGSGLAAGRLPVQGAMPTLPSVCKIHSFRLILNGNRPADLICQGRRRKKYILFITSSTEAYE
jgi:hypothetical protein